MKKTICLILSFVFLMFLTSCLTTFDGYSHNIDDAREQEASYYEKYDYIFTVEDKGCYVDFLICGEKLHTVKFDTKKQNNTTLYQIKGKSTFFIAEALSSFGAEADWTKTGNFPFQVE